MEALADAAGSGRLVIYTLAYCGLRWSELAALRVRNVDLLRRRLTIEEAFTEINGSRGVWGTPNSAASLAVAAGASVKAVQRMLGHASAAMTLDVYADLFDEELDEVADRLEAMHAAVANRPSDPVADRLRTTGEEPRDTAAKSLDREVDDHSTGPSAATNAENAAGLLAD